MVSERSSPTFRTRIRALAERDGIEGVQNFYGVSRRTVRRWISGDTAPQNPRTIRSIQRRGRRITGSVIQGRNPISGIFETILTGNAARAYEVRRTEMREERRVAIDNALTPSEREMAESMPSEPDIEQFRNWEERLERLREATLLNRLNQFEEYYGYDDTWEDWREDYAVVMGR